MTPQQALEHLTPGGRWPAPKGLDKARKALRTRTAADRVNWPTPLYFLTVHTPSLGLRAQPGHPVPGRLRRQLRRLLCSGHHLHRSERNDLLFERFVSQGAQGAADIDVDFEHERREIVMRIFETPLVGTTPHCASTVIRYRSRGGPTRRRGKALGLSEDLIKTLSSQVWSYSERGVEDRHAEELNSTQRSPTSARPDLSLPDRLSATPPQPAPRRVRSDPRPADDLSRSSWRR